MSQIHEAMKAALKKSLISSCVQPLQHIIKIAQTFDSDKHKVQAIQLYCNKTLDVVNNTIQKELT